MSHPRARCRVLRPTLDRLEERSLLSALTPAQMMQAYGLNAVTFDLNGEAIQGTGAGETIALVDAYHDPYLTSDLHTFDQTYGLSDPVVDQIDLASGLVNTGWAQEEMLDVEWAHAIAPGANLVVVEAASADTRDLLAAVNVARSVPGVVAVSMSWGGSETAKEAENNVYFTTPAGHTGITFVTASGDEGATGGAEWPAASTQVLAVGGSTLLTDGQGNYVGETAWIGSSGGFSKYVGEPSYQYSVQSSGRRSTPDVAFDADPDTGVMVYTTDPTSGFGSWIQVGGTSLGAPAWSAIIAIADEGRALAGKSSLDGGSQTLPTLYSLPASDFHKIGSLTSTGLGTPNGPSLVDGLVASDLAEASPAISIGTHATRDLKVKHTRLVRSDAAAPSPSSHHAVDAAIAALARARESHHHG